MPLFLFMDSAKKIFLFIWILIGSYVVLQFGQSLIKPFIYSFLIYFVLRSIKGLINKISFFKNRIANWIKNLIASTILISLLYLIVNTVYVNAKALPSYFKNNEQKLEDFTSKEFHLFNYNLTEKFNTLISSINFENIIANFVNSLGNFISEFSLMIFFIIFLFIEESMIRKRLVLILGEKYKQTAKSIFEIEQSISHYLGVKTLVNLISAISCFTTLYIFGIHFTFLWASCIFILNFIPVVGIFVAISLPAIFSILQFGDIQTTTILFFILLGIQTFIGNFLEPKLFGNSLNISPLIAIFSFALWGMIWGVGGMVVSIPLTVIIIIILSKFNSTKKAAILLSYNGEIK